MPVRLASSVWKRLIRRDKSRRDFRWKRDEMVNLCRFRVLRAVGTLEDVRGVRMIARDRGGNDDHRRKLKTLAHKTLLPAGLGV